MTWGKSKQVFVSRRQSAGLSQGGLDFDGSWSRRVWIDYPVQYFSLAVKMNDPILSGLKQYTCSISWFCGSEIWFLCSGSPRAEVKVLDVLGC